MSEDEDRLSIPTIAKLRSVSQETVHNWIDSGKLAAEEEYRGHQRRRFVQRAEWERFAATLPPVQHTE